MDQAGIVPVSDVRVVLLHPADNVLVCCQAGRPGDRIACDGATIALAEAVDLGHKIARRDLRAGEDVIKYGVCIGAMTAAAKAGHHVHVDNMTSKYIGSTSRGRRPRPPVQS
jgi:hypothetical protein